MGRDEFPTFAAISFHLIVNSWLWTVLISIWVAWRDPAPCKLLSKSSSTHIAQKRLENFFFGCEERVTGDSAYFDISCDCMSLSTFWLSNLLPHFQWNFASCLMNES